MKAIRQRWKETVSALTDSDILNKHWFKALQYFKPAECFHLRDQMESSMVYILRTGRLAAHAYMYTLVRHIVFHGKQVWSTFLESAFHFSWDFQSAVSDEVRGRT